jgi:hypothetical protein
MALALNDRKQLHKVLVDALPTVADLDLMTGIYLGVPREHISGKGAVPHIVLDLIVWADSRGRVADLLEAAREANPTHPDLRDLATRLLAATPAPSFAAVQQTITRAEFSTSAEAHQREEQPKTGSVPAITAEVLQRIALRSIEFLNTQDFRQTMAERELAVCRVEFPCEAGQGTGFLVASDLVITNYHVVEPFITKARAASEICCRFGYQMTSAMAQPEPGVAYTLADDWLVAASPVDQLDYAVMRLRQQAPAAADVASRPPLKPVAHQFETGEAIFIIQHPKTAPLKLSSGGLVKAEDRRVFYLANTLKGSSGSPCFDGNWGLVALHRSGEDVANVGVPFAAIRADLQAKNLGALLSS